MDGNLRWGIIGTGSIAATFAADMTLTDSGQVVAVGSRHRQTAERFADRFDIPRRHGSYLSLVDDDEVDVVYVATPHPMHLADATMALEHGKPVLVEKAFTMNAAEALTLVATARDRGLFLMEAMWTRFLPHMVEIRRLLSSGVLGEMVAVTADFGRWFPPDPSSRLFAPELGGGALLDLGVYPVSFASMVLGPPDRILSLVAPAFTGVDGQTSVLLGHRDGAQAVLTCTSSATTPTRATMVGTDARIEIDPEFYSLAGFTLIPRGGESHRFERTGEGRGLHYEADEVARCLEAGLLESPIMPLDESVSIMTTMDMILAGGQGR
jgi:predicted dehydrogenase